MQNTREEFHKFIDQVPPSQLTADVLGRMKTLLAAAERATASVRAPGPNSGEISKLAVDLQTLVGQIREFDLTNLEIQTRLASIQRDVAELAVSLAEREHRLAFLNAPEDDEEETEDELAAVAEAREDIHAGRTRAWSEVRQELERADTA